MIRRIYNVSIDCFGKTPLAEVYIRKIIKRYKINIFSDPKVHPYAFDWNK